MIILGYGLPLVAIGQIEYLLQIIDDYSALFLCGDV